MTQHQELTRTLWLAADKLRSNMDAAEYKHVVLGLIFLKYISDAFEELYEKLKEGSSETGADPEDKDEYTAERVFYVPPQARWKWLQNRAKLPTIGTDIDDAMDAIEKNNPTLQGVLSKDYGRPALDKQRLGELIDLIGSISLNKNGNGKSRDILGFVFEYFLGQFADAEGSDAGMKIPVKDLLALEKSSGKNALNIYYYSSQLLPKGKALASIKTGSQNATSLRHQKNENFIISSISIASWVAAGFTRFYL